MLEKEFVPYQESLELKEIGFNKPCFGYYVDGELRGVNLGLEELGGVKPYYKRFGFHTICNSDINNTKKSAVTAPTFSQAFRWFDENTELKGFVVPGIKEEHFDWLIRIDWEKEIECEEAYSSRIEAELACLRKLIEIANGKQ